MTNAPRAMTALVASRRTGHLRTVPVADVDSLTAEWFIVCRDTDIQAPRQRKRRRLRPARTNALESPATYDPQLEQKAREMIIEQAKQIEKDLRDEMRKRGLL